MEAWLDRATDFLMAIFIFVGLVVLLIGVLVAGVVGIYGVLHGV